jgi:hypothetical protein
MLTIQALLDRIIREFGGPLAATVDTVKAGDPAQASPASPPVSWRQ